MDHAHVSKIPKNIDLKLGGKHLNSLDFLNKFVKEFPNIQQIDLANNQVSNKEMLKLADTLRTNPHIQDIKVKGNKANRETKAFMEKELAKNKKIMELQVPSNVLGDSVNPGLLTLDLKGKGLVEASWLSKMMADYNFLQELNLSDNNLGPKGAQDVADMIVDNAQRGHTIRKVNISDNNIGAQGL